MVMDSKSTCDYFNDLADDFAKGEYSALKSSGLWQIIEGALEAQGWAVRSDTISGWGLESQALVGELMDLDSGARLKVEAELAAKGPFDWEFSLKGFVTRTEAHSAVQQLLGTSWITCQNRHVKLVPHEHHFDAQGCLTQLAPVSELPVFCERFARGLSEAISQ